MISLDTIKIGKTQVNLLERLSNAVGVSGDEEQIRGIIIDSIKSVIDEYQIDALGNVLAIKHAKTPGSMKVMFAAHMDEVGFMIVDEDSEGLFMFEPVGGIDERQLLAKPVLVGKERLPGLIGCKPIHLASAEEMHQSPPIKSLRIDVTPPNAGKVKKGDYATFASKFLRSGNSLFGKALDDRLGVATLIELAKIIPDSLEVLFAFTVQEEIGLRGARVAAFEFKPDVAFVIDSTPAFDFPVSNGSENTLYNCRLDAGPAIYLSDAGTISDPRLIRFLVQIAEENRIPYQFRQPGGGGTDAGAIHRNRTGIPSVSISIPGRYAHSPILHARINDWQNTLRLLVSASYKLDSNILSEPR